MEEEDRLIHHAAPHLKPLIIIAVDTGGRRSELLGLNWKHVDLSERRVTFVNIKNGEDRTVRLCRRAVETLNALGPKSSGTVFTYHGKPMNYIKTAFDRARVGAGIEDFRFHDLRHAFASRLVQGGLPLYNVMQLTGHKSLSMVQRYVHLAPDFQENAMEVLDAQRKSNWLDLGTVAHSENSMNEAKSL